MCNPARGDNPGTAEDNYNPGTGDIRIRPEEDIAFPWSGLQSEKAI
jgi:hypothetical protein